jgi:hypothetical protein
MTGHSRLRRIRISPASLQTSADVVQRRVDPLPPPKNIKKKICGTESVETIQVFQSDDYTTLT